MAAFLSVFWTMGYRRLGERLRRGVDQPELAPPRSQARSARRWGARARDAGAPPRPRVEPRGLRAPRAALRGRR